MYNALLEKMVLEASLDEVYVHFVAQNAMATLGISKSEFDRFVDEYKINNYITIEFEKYTDIESGESSDFALFKSTDKTIDRIVKINNT